MTRSSLNPIQANFIVWVDTVCLALNLPLYSTVFASSVQPEDCTGNIISFEAAAADRETARRIAKTMRGGL